MARLKGVTAEVEALTKQMSSLADQSERASRANASFVAAGQDVIQAAALSSGAGQASGESFRLGVAGAVQSDSAWAYTESRRLGGV